MGFKQNCGKTKRHVSNNNFTPRKEGKEKLKQKQLKTLRRFRSFPLRKGKVFETKLI